MITREYTMKDKSSKETPSLNIYQRINAVMGDVEYILKGANAAKGLPYKFVSHDQVTGKLRGPMQKHGIVMLTDIVELKQDGNKTEAKVAMTFINIDDPNDRFVVHFWGHGIDNQDKGIGKCVSYAVKYCLLKTFCLETGDDVERDNIDHVSTADQPISKSDLRYLELLINGYDDIRATIQSKCGGDLSKLTVKQFNPAIAWVESELAKKESVNAG